MKAVNYWAARGGNQLSKWGGSDFVVSLSTNERNAIAAVLYDLIKTADKFGTKEGKVLVGALRRLVFISSIVVADYRGARAASFNRRLLTPRWGHILSTPHLSNIAKTMFNFAALMATGYQIPSTSISEEQLATIVILGGSGIICFKTHEEKNDAL